VLFPEVFEFMEWQIESQSKGVTKLHDLFPEEQENDALAHLKRITQWIEGLPISKLPYVDIGFDTLSGDLVQKLDLAVSEIREENTAAKIQCQDVEHLQAFHVYQENFPFWVSPFQNSDTSGFVVGDRVMSINSLRRKYLPFGLRGTIIGKTADNVIVLFDEQFLNGDTVYGRCSKYRGAIIQPQQVINITKRFKNIKAQNPEIVDRFLQSKATNDNAKRHTGNHKQLGDDFDDYGEELYNQRPQFQEPKQFGQRN